MVYQKFRCHLCKRDIYFEGSPTNAIQTHWWNSHVKRGRVAPNPGQYRIKTKKTVKRVNKRKSRKKR